MGTSDIEILLALREHRSPAVGATDIAEVVGVTRQAVDRRLRNMRNDGLVEKYDAGSRATVWYLTPAGKRYLEDLG